MLDKRSLLILGIIISAFMGVFLYAYLQNWIIFAYPNNQQVLSGNNNQLAGSKKNIRFTFWHNGKWHHETQELICPVNKSEQIFYIVNSWLALLDEEHVTDKKVMLQTAILSGTDSDVYLSFDRNPLNQEQATFEQWMWIEGLLKTLQENVSSLHTIQFLVHHQPLQNTHLDFTNPWPVNGFLQRS